MRCYIELLNALAGLSFKLGKIEVAEIAPGKIEGETFKCPGTPKWAGLISRETKRSAHRLRFRGNGLQVSLMSVDWPIHIFRRADFIRRENFPVAGLVRAKKNGHAISRNRGK